MSAFAQDAVVRSSVRRRISTMMMSIWCGLVSRLPFLERFCEVPPMTEQELEESREEVMDILGEGLANEALKEEVCLKEHVSALHERFLRIYRAEDFEVVLWEAMMYLTEKYYENMEFAKESEFKHPYLDLAERCLDQRRELDVYSTELVLERVYGREADPVVIHLTSGPH